MGVGARHVKEHLGGAARLEVGVAAGSRVVDRPELDDAVAAVRAAAAR